LPWAAAGGAASCAARRGVEVRERGREGGRKGQGEMRDTDTDTEIKRETENKDRLRAEMNTGCEIKTGCDKDTEIKKCCELCCRTRG
jgi:hypothetical protein